MRIILPESSVSTYQAMKLCDTAIIYGTKMGVELTSMGIPVVVCGEAWIRGKGLTIDISNMDDYFKVLNTLPLGKRLNRDVQEQALKYAFHFFFRRMIPIKYIESTGGFPTFVFKLGGIMDLARGKCAGLDVVCDGIIFGNEFIYKAEDYIEN